MERPRRFLLHAGGCIRISMVVICKDELRQSLEELLDKLLLLEGPGVGSETAIRRKPYLITLKA